MWANVALTSMWIMMAWVVDLKHGKQELKTFLDEKDAELCMDGKQCVSLGIEISQLRDNLRQL